MTSAQEIIDEIEEWEIESERIKRISANTWKQWAKIGVEPYYDDPTQLNNGGKTNANNK